MNSKTRTLASLAHKEPDRVPFDLGATNATGIHVLAYRSLLSYLGRESALFDCQHPKWMDPITGCVRVDTEIVKQLKIDVRGLIPQAISGAIHREADSDVVIDELGARWHRGPDAYYFDQRKGTQPLAAAQEVADIESYNWPDATAPAQATELQEEVRALGEEYTIAVGDPIGGVLFGGFRMRGYLEFYLDLAGNPAVTCELMDYIPDLNIRYWTRLRFVSTWMR